MLDKIASVVCILLIVVYVVLCILYALDKQGWKSLYWLGAALINLAVLKMR